MTGLDVLGMMLRRGPIHTLLAARRVNATLDRVWWVWLFNRLTLNCLLVPCASRYSSAPVDTAADCAPATPGRGRVQAPGMGRRARTWFRKTS